MTFPVQQDKRYLRHNHTINELVSDGWQRVGDFGGLDIMAKENERLLYNSVYQHIVVLYEANNEIMSKIIKDKS